MKYKRVIATRYGPPEVLQVVEEELRPPAPKEVRIRVLASAVTRPDVTVRRGEALYSGTPLGYKAPFTPGYTVIGDVDAVGEGVTEARPGDRVGVLTVVGGYSEYVYWRSDRLIPVPTTVDPAAGVTLMLNYIVAYQALHRSAKVQAGETALIIGASGGIGTALLQLGQVAGLKLYGLASPSKHAILRTYGATPLDYHTADLAAALRQAEPAGIDVVLDGMTQAATVRQVLPLLRPGGRLVSFGEPAGLGELVRIFALFARTNFLPTGKSCKLYGTSFYFVGDRQPFLEDWATLFRMVEDCRIQPVIHQKFPILEAAQANALLESGAVIGNVVLVAPELLV